VVQVELMVVAGLRFSDLGCLPITCTQNSGTRE
jgi:hypothetical protein